MNNELITKNNEWVVHFMKSLERMTEGIEQLAASCRPLLSGERYLTDKELSARLKVSRRTLQDYRTEGRLPYIQLGGKSYTGRVILRRYWKRGTGRHSG